MPRRPNEIAVLRGRLLQHYDLHRRRLPWREEHDPYRTWVSEVMLQQTRVETVIPYYRRWLERFPDVASLADAPEDDVLALWAGLGYYRRARNLHAAARVVRDRHAGRLPEDPAALRTLPGFGGYTAGAVASIAFGAPVPAVDGNVRRILSRLFDLADPPPSELAELAAELVDPERAGDFNQALMELGQRVCTPTGPLCGQCPVAAHCLAHERGTVGERPRRKARRGVPERAFAVAVVVDGRGRTLLVRRPATGLLARMWAFPEVELAEHDGRGEEQDAAGAAAAARRAAAGLGIRVGPRRPRELTPVRHAFTHLRATYLPFLFSCREATLPEPSRARWVDPLEPGVALPAAQKRIMEEASGR